MVENELQETESVLRFVDGAAQKRFREALNCREWRSKFVRNVGNEIAADALELAQVGDVVQHKYGPGRFSSAHRRGGCGKKSLAQRPGYNLRVDRRFTTQHFVDGLNQFRLPNRLNENATDRWRQVQAQNLGKPWVREYDAVCRVHHGHAFYHAAENRRREVALISERANGK